MSKDFDLEAAKRGEPIQIRGATNMPVYFVGVKRDGTIVIENEGNIFGERETHLRMAPKKAVRQYRRFKHKWHDGTILIDVLNRGIIYSDPHDLEKAGIFVGWIDFEWQTVEIEL